jgi:thiol-disulfide isomerase/thioredoxin
VFVNDVLFAQPDDFGWFGAKGKYTPWREAVNHDRFKSDLSKMIDIMLLDPTGSVVPTVRSVNEREIGLLPNMTLQNLQGQPIAFSDLSGKVVIVEFWATWCPPCLSTLGWLGNIKKKYGNNVAIVAIAIESKEDDVRKLATSLNLAVQFVMGSEQLVAPFGSLSGVPKMFVFDKNGKTASIFYGAPEDLHTKAGRLVDGLMK